MSKYEGRTVLLEIDDWILVTPRPGVGSHLKSLPLHQPCNSGCYLTDKEGHHIPKCSNCRDPVPEEIEALYILHNWEVRERA